MTEEVDHLIIGAGLAGLTLHRFLDAGRVALLDPHPCRYKLGESLVPEHFADPALAALAAEARRLPSVSPKRGSVYVGDDSVAAFPVSPLDQDRTLHLRREELEQRMIDLWRVPIERERVASVDLDAGLVRTDRRAWRVRGQVFDCSGVARVLARALGVGHELWPSWSSWMYLDIRAVHDERFMAWVRATGRAYGRFDPGVGHALPDAEYEGWAPSECTLVRRVRDGMFAWQIPLYQKTVLSFGVTSRHGPVSRDDLLAIARECVAPCFDVAPRPFDGSSDYNRFHVYNRFSRGARRVADERWALVGDAAFFGEPIYATGTAVAVNQALYLARAINERGWTPATCADYTARWERMVDASLAARRYFFTAEGEGAATSAMHDDRGLRGTPFQLTMAQNYGRILAGVRNFVAGDEQFGSRHLATRDDFERTLRDVRALLGEDVSGWTVRGAYRAGGGVQMACAHVALPDLTVRVERKAEGRRYYREAAGMGVAYMSLPDRAYPFGAEARALLDAVVASIERAPRGWEDAMG